MKQHNFTSASKNDFQEKALEYIDVLNLLPQRPPFIMIDHLIHFDPIITQTRFTIRKENMFLQPDGHYEEAGLIETIAQSCAARMEELMLELKNEIIKVLNLEGIKPEDINDDDEMFSKGLGLDSIDALELIVMLEKNYGIKLTDPAKGKEIFKSIRIMAEYVAANRKK